MAPRKDPTNETDPNKDTMKSSNSISSFIIAGKKDENLISDPSKKSINPTTHKVLIFKNNK